MKVLLDTFRQARSKSNTWLIPVFEGKLAAAAKTYGFDPRSARTWGFEGKTGQSLTLTLAKRNHYALLIGAGKAKDFTTEQARCIIGRAVRNGAVQKADKGTVVFAAASLAGTKVAGEALAEALAEGAVLGGYAFTRLRGKGTPAADLPKFPAKLIIGLDRLRQVDRR
ncbi:MAG: hypothetical protein IIA66_10165, partial [Planctomycetes bacterium]|nr:hypothetical protein [Planctomycetota bacterium]